MDYTGHGIFQARITGVGILSLLQGIFATQESNWGVLHCRPILYQLSYQGSPKLYEDHESEVTQSCPTLCDPVDCSPPGSPVRGILQARVREWVAISFSRGSYCSQMASLASPSLRGHV